MKKEQRKRVLIISHDKISHDMAGVGIRYHFMGNILSKISDVTVGFFGPDYMPPADFKRSYEVLHVDVPNFRQYFKDFDIVISAHLNEEMIAYCQEKNIIMVFDLYAPAPVETLALFTFGKKASSEQDYVFKNSIKMYQKFFEYGDLILCSNRRHLDFWVGFYFGAGQVKPSTYSKRPIYDMIIECPMGTDSSARVIKPNKPVMKGAIKGIKKTDKVILWTGGIYDWFDGRTLIRAMQVIKDKHPEIKLVFFGTKHPNKNVPEMKESIETKKLSKSLGLTGKNVFFSDGWVPYNECMHYLAEADAAVYTHFKSIEAEFSHRTRVIDSNIKACLPTVGSSGDYLGDEVINKYNLGLMVSPGDCNALASAIIDIVKDDNNRLVRSNIAKYKKTADWSNTLKPLVDYIQSGPIKVPIQQDSVIAKQPQIRYWAKRLLPERAKKSIRRLMGKVL